MALHQLDPLGGEAGVGGDLDRRRLAVEQGGEALGAGVDEAVVLAHVGRHADRAGAVGDGPADRLADPPRGVRGELEAAAMVELLDRPHQPEVALLDEVEQRQPARLVATRHRHHEPEVGLDEAAARVGGVVEHGRQLGAPAGPDATAGVELGGGVAPGFEGAARGAPRRRR